MASKPNIIISRTRFTSFENDVGTSVEVDCDDATFRRGIGTGKVVALKYRP
jgi:hypothetical protein